MASNIMSIKIVSLKIERRGKLTLIIKFTCVKDFSTLFFFKDISSSRIYKVTFLINSASVFIHKAAWLVLKNERMTSIIPIKFSKNIIDVELPLLRISHIFDALVFFIVRIRDSLTFLKLLRHFINFFSHFASALGAFSRLLCGSKLFESSVHNYLFIVDNIVFIHISLVFLMHLD